MEKRYQVFISSTFIDLKEERSSVIQTVMEMDCIPAGMELFPAIDDEQFNFIKRIIDDCDYYLVIIGGRYGSISSEGLSYTEMEYDYAISKGIKVIGLLHRSPKELPVSKTDDSPELKEKLNKFREKVADSRLVRFWEKKEELAGLVALSLSKTMKTYPAVGWVRATNTGINEMLVEINELRKTNQELKGQLKSIKSGELNISEKTKLNLAEYSQKVTISGRYRNEEEEEAEWNCEISWGDLFKILSPYIFNNPNEDSVLNYIIDELFEETGLKSEYKSIYDSDFTKIKIQLLALELIKIDNKSGFSGGIGFWPWNLTEKGYNKMIELNSVKKVSS